VTARVNHQYPLESCPKQDWHDLSVCTVAVPCPRCGQVDEGQTGEYGCEECGLPMLHDEGCQS
jgi:hypothetical protein